VGVMGVVMEALNLILKWEEEGRCHFGKQISFIGMLESNSGKIK